MNTYQPSEISKLVIGCCLPDRLQLSALIQITEGKTSVYANSVSESSPAVFSGLMNPGGLYMITRRNDCGAGGSPASI